MPGREELPSTLRRSPAKAQETWVKAHDSAVGEYGGGARPLGAVYVVDMEKDRRDLAARFDAGSICN
jgi:hypothetical protein